PHASLRVTVLEAEFLVDSQGQTWFSHARETKVQRSKGSLRLEALHAKRKRQGDRGGVVSKEAREAARELRELLGLAARRGLDLADAFHHFDPKGVGVVGEQEVWEGMQRLGVKLSRGSARDLVRIVTTAG
ncbi:unnamed protein product, partial [Discosporangium mesarthrocarpum]